MNDKYKKIVDEIGEMVKIDQKLKAGNNIDWDEVTKVDAKHSSRMKEILNEIGFPSISKVGKKVNTDAWLLVQHSPDTTFMEEHLALMEKQDESEYQKPHYAYLKDKILINMNKPQIYGTQVIPDKVTGKFKLWDVENEKELDKRRKQMDLEPIDEYLKNFN